MVNYQLTTQSISLPATTGGTISLRLTQNSGRIVYRDKINTIIGIKHPGIELGVDQFGNRWIAHHHYRNVAPTIDREDIFSLGETIFYDHRPVAYNRLEIVERTLASWWNSTEYHWLWQNCQHFVNEAVDGKHESNAINDVADKAMIGGAIIALLGIFSENETLIKAGLGIATVGGGAKLLSKELSNNNRKIDFMFDPELGQ